MILSPRGVDSVTIGMTESVRTEGRQARGKEVVVGEEGKKGARGVMLTVRACRRNKVFNILASVVCIGWV